MQILIHKIACLKAARQFLGIFSTDLKLRLLERGFCYNASVSIDRVFLFCLFLFYKQKRMTKNLSTNDCMVLASYPWTQSCNYAIIGYKIIDRAIHKCNSHVQNLHMYVSFTYM